MAYVPVPKDMNAVKTKVAFNLTKRQIVCFGAGLLVGLPAFFLIKGHVSSSTATLLMVLVMLPFFMFAMFERHGQPLEKLIRQYMQARYVRPRTRAYQTDNFYATIDENIRIRREVNHILHDKAQEKGKGKDQADAGRKEAAAGPDEAQGAAQPQQAPQHAGHDSVSADVA